MTSLLGRDRAVEEVAGLVERAGVRLVTLTGPGGVGKTRLAVAVGERLQDRFAAGTVFVPLDAVTDPGLLLAAIGRAAGADLAGTSAPVEALAETFGAGAWLLILDNLEQVVGVAPDLGELLARCPQLAIVATSRTVLGLRAEREYPVPPLLLPADPATVPLEELESWPAVALFVDRARAVRPGFALTEGNAGRPVRIALSREGVYRVVGGRARTEQRVAIGARADGRFDALIHTGTVAKIRRNYVPEPFILPAMCMYAADSLELDVRAVYLDMLANTFMRAPGDSVGSVALESVIDELAERIGMDPLELGLRNEPACPSSRAHGINRDTVTAWR